VKRDEFTQKRRRALMARRRSKREDPVLRSLRNIEAKLDRINERLDKFLSAKTRSKRAARTGNAEPAKRVVVFGTKEAAEKYLKTHPGDADDVIITGVPRPNRD
jgi:hypothetical protein